jgi:[protein-PII] uridylyltransferase
MSRSIKNINKDFVLHFPEIYTSPNKVNKYLKNHSKQIENIILKHFNDFDLTDDYSIYANGGFGRQEMFPSSDIDISIIQNKKTVKNSINLEKFIAKLWDLGFQVGHSVRTVQDIKVVARDDLKEFTSYFTRRALITNKNIDLKINKALQKVWSKNKFFKAKLQEQKDRYKSFHSTEYNLEPDIKESPGSLRDFQTSLWILQHCFNLKTIKDIKNSNKFCNEIDNAVKAYNFIKALRFATNIITKSNRLSFETQIEIANMANLSESTSKRSVESMMQKYYENAAILSNFNNLVFEIYREKGIFVFKKKIGDFYIIKNKIGFNVPDLLKRKDLFFKLFITMGQFKNIDAIDTSTMSTIKENIGLIDDEFKNDQYYASQFLAILKSKYNLSSILNSMKNLGILQKYIKEFEEVIGQMQFDLFHVYTVDEHTFKVIKNMRRMQIHFDNEFKLEHELINRLPKIEILYLAGLFHDLGKGKGGDHSKIGASTSLSFAKRIGLSLADADLISWLVLNHLQMSSISQKKDISDPSTINSFANLVTNTERLDYLYLLTINDIRATNPALWNGWKHGLLRELFLSTRSKLNKEPIKPLKEISKDRKKNIFASLKVVSEKELLKSYFELFDDSYFTKNNSERLKWQSEIILNDKKDDFIVGCRSRFGNLLEIFIKTNNFDGLFLKLAEILDLSGLEIIDANISTSINKSIAANTFITKFSHHNRTLSNSELDEVKQRIKNNFINFSFIKSNIKIKNSSAKNFNKVVNISNVQEKSKKRNLLTIETSDSPGLLAKIARVLFENGTSIYSARINTLGDRVEDTFEIEDVTLSCVADKKIKKISKSLKEII